MTLLNTVFMLMLNKYHSEPFRFYRSSWRVNWNRHPKTMNSIRNPGLRFIIFKLICPPRTMTLSRKWNPWDAMVILILPSIYPPTWCRFMKLFELGAELTPMQNNGSQKIADLVNYQSKINTRNHGKIRV